MTTDDDTDQIEDWDITTAEVPMLVNSTITQVEDAAMILCVDEPEVEVQSWLNLSSVLTARVKLIRQRIEQIAIKHIETHGPIVSGDLEYTVGYRSEVKCIDRQPTWISSLKPAVAISVQSSITFALNPSNMARFAA